MRPMAGDVTVEINVNKEAGNVEQPNVSTTLLCQKDIFNTGRVRP